MSYQAPTLLLIGAAQGLVLGSTLIVAAHDKPGGSCGTPGTSRIHNC
jgi:hypothetical protein